MSGYVPREGDYVRASVEGHVRDRDDGLVIIPEDGRCFGMSGFTFEKIDPPVVSFKPGDRVRDKNVPAYEYTLGVDGFIDHLCDNQWFYYEVDDPDILSEFPAGQYELVQ